MFRSTVLAFVFLEVLLLPFDRFDDGCASSSCGYFRDCGGGSPLRFGAYNVDMLATCHELGVTEVYRVGGAQAVAALAFGTQHIKAVDKIVGLATFLLHSLRSRFLVRLILIPSRGLARLS